MRPLIGHAQMLPTLFADAALKKVIKSTLAQMVEGGEIVQMGKSYGLMDNLPRMTGTLDVRRSGVGYLISEDRRQKDLFIHPSNFGGAWPGDRVVAVIDTTRKKDAPEGRVVEVLDRFRAEGCSEARAIGRLVAGAPGVRVTIDEGRQGFERKTACSAVSL